MYSQIDYGEEKYVFACLSRLREVSVTLLFKLSICYVIKKCEMTVMHISVNIPNEKVREKNVLLFLN